MKIERIYIPEVEQHNALSAAADKEVTRDKMAEFYRDCIIASQIGTPGVGKVDFKVVNAAIMKRWPHGLDCIKSKAWQMLEKIHRGRCDREI